MTPAVQTFFAIAVVLEAAFVTCLLCALAVVAVRVLLTQTKERRP